MESTAGRAEVTGSDVKKRDLICLQLTLFETDNKYQVYD
jgi:hypothetical protein